MSTPPPSPPSSPLETLRTVVLPFQYEFIDPDPERALAQATDLFHHMGVTVLSILATDDPSRFEITTHEDEFNALLVANAERSKRLKKGGMVVGGNVEVTTRPVAAPPTPPTPAPALTAAPLTKGEMVVEGKATETTSPVAASPTPAASTNEGEDETTGDEAKYATTSPRCGKRKRSEARDAAFDGDEGAREVARQRTV